MISRDRFVRVINFVKKMHEAEDEINEVYKRNNMEFNNFSFCEYEGELIDLLIDCVNDEDDWICWWIYDTKCGKELANDNLWAEDENGNKIDLTTPEKLYDYIVKSIDNN